MAKSKSKCVFTPLITGVTPLYRPTQPVNPDDPTGAQFTIVYAFIVEGHHFVKDTADTVVLGNFSHGYDWKLVSAQTLDPCHILVQATVASPHDGVRATAGAGSGDLTVTVTSPPPPPPPGGVKKKKDTKTKASAETTVMNAFTVYYPDDPKKK